MKVDTSNQGSLLSKNLANDTKLSQGDSKFGLTKSSLTHSVEVRNSSTGKSSNIENIPSSPALSRKRSSKKPEEKPITPQEALVNIYCETKRCGKHRHCGFHYSDRSCQEAYNNGFERLWSDFKAYKCQVLDTVPVYCETPLSGPLRNETFLYTTRSSEEAKKDGYEQIGIAFYAFNKPGPNRILVHCEKSIAESPHDSDRYHYSPRNEKQALNHGYRTIGDAFYCPL